MDAVDNMRKAGQDMISAASADDPYVRGKIISNVIRSWRKGETVIRVCEIVAVESVWIKSVSSADSRMSVECTCS